MTNRNRLVLFVAGAAIAVGGMVASACSDDEAPGDPTPGSSSSVIATPAVAASPAAEDPTPVGTIEVRGVVGAVDVQTRTIDIRPTGDAAFDRIIVAPATAIKTAGGPTIRLEDVRPSDRIIAFGRPGDDPDVLLSSDITVQAILPGSQPGG